MATAARTTVQAPPPEVQQQNTVTGVLVLVLCRELSALWGQHADASLSCVHPLTERIVLRLRPRKPRKVGDHMH